MGAQPAIRGAARFPIGIAPASPPAGETPIGILLTRSFPIGNLYALRARPYSLVMPDRDSLAAFVRARRLANRMTQRELAELAGLGVRLVSEVERGKTTTRMDVVNRLLAVFGKTLGVVDAPRSEE